MVGWEADFSSKNKQFVNEQTLTIAIKVVSPRVALKEGRADARFATSADATDDDADAVDADGPTTDDDADARVPPSVAFGFPKGSRVFCSSNSNIAVCGGTYLERHRNSTQLGPQWRWNGAGAGHTAVRIRTSTPIVPFGGSD